jgi:probable HAF family extracellular repeat protein
MLDLGTAGAGTWSQAYAINDSGQFTGRAATNGIAGDHAVRGRLGSPMEDLGTLGGSGSFGYDINNLGRVVGFSSMPTSGQHAFFRDVSGPMHDLGTLGGRDSWAYALNESGVVVGASQMPGNTVKHAFIWYGSGALVDLGTITGTSSSAAGINDLGQVVLWSGISGMPQNGFAFLRQPNGTVANLGTLGGSYSYPSDINNLGWVVGYSQTASGASHGFLYDGIRLRDVNDLIDPVPGWELGSANGINDHGWITGTGYYNGELNAYVLVPVPEPGSLFLLASGGFVIARRRPECKKSARHREAATGVQKECKKGHH